MINKLSIFKEEIKKELARREHLKFIQYCWFDKKEPYVIGIHTQKICEYVDYTFSEFRNGKSTFGIIQTPPQHGKSTIISKFFAPHFFGEFPEKELIMVSHSATLAYEFSKFGRNLILNSNEYKELYPEIKLAKDSRSVESWTIGNNIGKAKWFGLTSGIAGSGGDCNILDDYLGNREDADSPKIREKIWNEFKANMITRRHEPSIFIILATQWHIDDIIGRYKTEMKNNPKFPKAEIITFSAVSKNYKTGYLFPEMYSPEFYDEQKIILGNYDWLSLYQQTPISKGGNLFDVNGINIIDIDNKMVYEYGHENYRNVA